MSSFVTETKARILAILGIETTIERATTESLRDSVDFPLATISTGSATYDRTQGKDNYKLIRDFIITIYGKALEEGIELEAEDTLDPFFERIPALFMTRPSLTTIDNTDPLDNVQDAYLTDDGGFDVVELPFGEDSRTFATATFVLRVEYLYSWDRHL